MEVFQLLRSWAMSPVFSILAQPLGWVQYGSSSLGGSAVSILTHPLGWVQCRTMCQFSILTQSLGWMHLGYGSLSTASVISDDSRVFNPRPTSRLGATFDLRIVGLVSILAQPIGWVQRPGINNGLDWFVFQSSLNLSAGCSWFGPRVL